MSRKKNLLEYIFMAIMLMCLGLALSAFLAYATLAKEREYLLQGRWVLSIAGLCLLLYFGIRLYHKLSLHTSEKLKSALWIAASLLIFCVGFLLRLLVIQRIPVEPASDFKTYYSIATHLVEGTLLTPEAESYREYVALYPHVIGYPMLVLQPVFSIFGVSVNNALYANLACSMLAVLVAAHIGYRLHGRMGSFAVLALTSLWPSHIFFSNMVATEPAFTLLILVASDMMLTVLARGENSLYVRSTIRLLALDGLLGVVLAIAGAIRPMAVVLLAAFAVAQLSLGREGNNLRQVPGSRRPITTSLLCLGVAVLMYVGTSAIMTRTIQDTIQEAPASGLSASGYNLMVGVNASSQGLWNQEDADFFMNTYEETQSATIAHERCLEKALERISNFPEDTLNLLVYKFRDLWQTDDFGIDWNLWMENQQPLTEELKSFLESVRPIGSTMYMLLLVLVTIAVLDAWRKTRAPHPFMMVCILFFLGTALAHMLLETQVRYHYNMIPFLIILSSWALQGWRERVQEEPPVKLVEVVHETQETYVDHTRFDMNEAILNGNIHVSVSKKYADDAQAACPTPPVKEPEASNPPPADEAPPGNEPPPPAEPTQPEQEQPQGECDDVAEESDAGVRHQAGSHQNVSPGQRAENPSYHSNRRMRHRSAQADAGSGAGNLSRSAGLRPVHHAGPANPVRRNLQYPASHSSGTGAGKTRHRIGSRRYQHNLRHRVGMLLPSHTRRPRGGRSAHL